MPIAQVWALYRTVRYLLSFGLRERRGFPVRLWLPLSRQSMKTVMINELRRRRTRQLSAQTYPTGSIARGKVDPVATGCAHSCGITAARHIIPLASGDAK